MPTPRVLLGMTLGAVVAALGALFLGEYEFDEWLPILSGALLGLIVAEVVVSVGKLRNLALAVVVAAWAATAVVLAGMLDANETEPIKWGAYLSAALSALAALARVNEWRTAKASTSSGKSSKDKSTKGTTTSEKAKKASARRGPDRSRPTERPARPESRRQPAERPARPQARPERPSRPQSAERPARSERLSERPARSERPSRPQPTGSPRPAPRRTPPGERRLPPADVRPSPRPAPRPVADQEWAEEEWAEQPAPPRIPSGPVRVRASARRLQPTDGEQRAPDRRRARPAGGDPSVRESERRSRRSDRGR